MFGMYSQFGLCSNYLCIKNYTISCFTILIWNRANFAVRGPSSLSVYFWCLIFISPCKRGCPSFEQTWINFPQGCFVQSLVEIGPVVLEKNIFWILSMYFCYFIIISPWKKVLPFLRMNLNSLPPRMLCAKFGWNWPSGSGEEYF